MSLEVEHKAAAPFWRVFLAVSFYVITSITMILINKAVLRETTLPLAFLWSQLMVAAVILKAMSPLTFIPPLTFALHRSLLPLIAINVLGLTMNTLCLSHMDAMLYQIARSLVLPITVALTPLLSHRGDSVSARILAACTIITCGFLIGVFGDGLQSSRDVSVLGLTFGVLSSLTTALHSFVIKSSFGVYESKGVFDLVYLNNAFSALWLLPLLFLEAKQWPAFLTNSDEIRTFLIGALVAGVVGLLINVAGFLQIRLTSPLTHTVSSAARGVLQSIACYLLLSESLTQARILGIVVTLIGSCLYSWIKSDEQSKRLHEAKRLPPV